MRSLALLVIIAACGGTPGGSGDDTHDAAIDAKRDIPPTGNGSVFDPKITSVVVEIDYETGQAPYTGPIIGFGDTFDTTTNNIDRLFAHQKELTIPRIEGDMQDVGAIEDEELTVSDLLALATAHRDRHDSATTKTYYVIFVSGHFADANGPNPNILGVSIGDTGVLAMFKDVIRSTNVIGLPNVVRYVEQSTLVHELGHAIGLVDNGVHVTSTHKDAAHGAHCTNDKCVMYWLNEGASDAAQFAQMYVVGGTSILFGAECLADVDALTGGP